MFRTKGRSGYEIVFGHTPDISEYVEFIFYCYCWYWDNPQSFPHAKKQLGRWLGVAQRVGQAMVFNIMGFNGKVLARSTVIPLEPEEYNDPNVKQQIAALDTNIDKALGNTQNATTDSSISFPDQADYDAQLSFLFDLEPSEFDDFSDPHFSNPEIPDVDDAPNHDIESEEFDKFLGLYVEIPAGDGSKNVLAKVQERKRDHDGNLVGRYNENPILNTAVYNVRSPDGTLHEYTANVISQRIYDQVDDDGWNYDLLYEIINHRTDEDAIPPDKGYYEGPDGQRKRVITTKGWQLQVQWENGETTWISLKDIKESNPVEVAEYAIKEGIDSWPAFAWWVPRILKKRDAIVCKTSHKTRRMMKFGIPIPKDYEEAVKFDRANKNTLWQDGTAKEMKNVEVAFKFVDDGGEIPIGFKEITCHLIYDVKFTLDRKARYVAGGHRTKVDPSFAYSSVVSRDSVRIMFLVAALNDLDIAMCDIGNAYLQAETRERVWFKAGKEWGSRAGQKVIVTRALYGLRASGAEWKKTFADFIRYVLGYEPCIGADDNIYRKAETKADGSTYYAYIVVYVDDVLGLHENPNTIMDLIHKEFRLKSPPEAPTMYLGADISRYDLPEGELYKSCWAMSADSHIKKALQMLESNMNTDGVRFRSKKTAEHPFSSTSYRPELDISDPCTPEQTQFYQSNIGILLWLVELGRLDILTETSLLSSHLAAPRTGHLHQTLSIFKYLKDHNRSRIVFDPNMTNINDDDLPPEERALTKALWMAELYPDAQQYFPPNAPKPRGQPVQISCFVDSDHAGCRITRRSRTGILIYVNKAPILWYSKLQNTVETSTFGAEFVAMRQAMEMIKGLKYKLLMFGIEILENETKIYCDNNSVVLNSSIPESKLKKKHNSVNFHFVRECVASGLALVFKVDTNENLADIFTKILDKVKRTNLIKKILR